MKVVNVYGGTLSSSRVKRIGGIEEHFLSLSKILREDLYFVYAGDSKDSSFVNQLKYNGSHLIVLGDKTYFSYLKNFINLLRMLKEEDNDILVHVHFTPIAHMVVLASRFLGVKKVYWTKHSRLMISKYSKSWFLNKFSFLFVDKMVCVSNAVEKELKDLELLQTNLETIPLGLNLNKYKNDIPIEIEVALKKELKINPKDFVITVVAQQRPEKRVEVFIKAFAKFIEEANIQNVVGLIVGGGPLEEDNVLLSKKLGIYEKLRFTGLRHDINVIYKISSIAGLTSETEGLPFALMEACAMKLPLFGSNAGGIPEIVINNYNGYLFKVGDDHALADIFNKFYFNHTFISEFGCNSLLYLSKNYDVDKCVNQLVRAYQS